MSYELLREILRLRRNSLIFLAFLALLNLAVIVYLAFFQRPELARAQSEWLARREAQASGEEVVGSAARYQQGMRDLDAFRERLIAKPAFAAFLQKLFESAGRNSLELKGITYKPKSIPEQGMFSYGISYTVSGNYPGVKAFLADVAGYREIVTVESVSLSSSKPTEEAVDLRVQMTAYLKTEGE